MGQFSFLTSEGKSIAIDGASSRPSFTVYMVAPANAGCVAGTISSNDGSSLRWREDFYAGYGEFGGKDIYELTAELNGVSATWMEHEDMRSVGIAIVSDNDEWAGKTMARITGKYPGFYCVLSKLLHGNKGTLMIPRLTEDPGADWEDLRPLATCPHQGFLYPDNI